MVVRQPGVFVCLTNLQDYSVRSPCEHASPSTISFGATRPPEQENCRLASALTGASANRTCDHTPQWSQTPNPRNKFCQRHQARYCSLRPSRPFFCLSPFSSRPSCSIHHFEPFLFFDHEVSNCTCPRRPILKTMVVEKGGRNRDPGRLFWHRLHRHLARLDT